MIVSKEVISGHYFISEKGEDLEFGELLRYLHVTYLYTNIIWQRAALLFGVVINSIIKFFHHFNPGIFISFFNSEEWSLMKDTRMIDLASRI